MNQANGDSYTRLYHIWAQMKIRCADQRMPFCRYYYLKGITVCDEWNNSYQTFKEWALSHGYNDNLSIDRIDGNKGYNPKNCRWATREEQQNNLSWNVKLTLNGKTQSVAQWAREVKIPLSTLYSRVYAGWNDEKVLTYPIDTKNHKKKK